MYLFRLLFASATRFISQYTRLILEEDNFHNIYIPGFSGKCFHTYFVRGIPDILTLEDCTGWEKIGELLLWSIGLHGPHLRSDREKWITIEQANPSNYSIDNNTILNTHYTYTVTSLFLHESRYVDGWKLTISDDYLPRNDNLTFYAQQLIIG